LFLALFWLRRISAFQNRKSVAPAGLDGFFRETCNPQDFAVVGISIYVLPLLGSNGPGSEKPSTDSTFA
jgi:hypothetical protein